MTDDKIQALVGLVLQAVDQRLGAVREQLVQVTQSIARNHVELSRRIDECQHLCESIQSGSVAGPGDTAGAGADAAAAQATGQLVEAANVLTDRVQFLEARVNQYTDDRIAEMSSLIQRIGGISAMAVPVGPTALTTSPAATSHGNVAPAVARLAPLGGALAATVTANPITANPITANPIAANPIAGNPVTGNPVTGNPVTAMRTASPDVQTMATADPQLVEQPIDVAMLSAQMNERLAAAVDRALSALSSPDASSSHVA